MNFWEKKAWEESGGGAFFGNDRKKEILSLWWLKGRPKEDIWM